MLVLVPMLLLLMFIKRSGACLAAFCCGALFHKSQGGEHLNNKTIQFVDSFHRELFRIPDGASIRITYPPEDGRASVVQSCKFLDEFHFQIGSNVYHIHEFAKCMDDIDATYEPVAQLEKVEILPFTPGEERFYTYNREEDNTCIGHFSGDFGFDGVKFHSNWHEQDNNRVTPEFHGEIHTVVYALRQSLLRFEYEMLAYCQSHPEAKLPDEGKYQVFGFKLETDTRQYYVRCLAASGGQFNIYAYDKPVQVLEQEQPARASSQPDREPTLTQRLNDAKKAADTANESQNAARETDKPKRQRGASAR